MLSMTKILARHRDLNNNSIFPFIDMIFPLLFLCKKDLQKKMIVMNFSLLKKEIEHLNSMGIEQGIADVFEDLVLQDAR
jgi:hypothetical protein